jgi:uncharacterized protein (DUF885 family)
MTMIKSFFKWFGYCLLAVLILAGLFGWHEYKSDKPFFINNFFNRVVVNIALDSPETLSSLHLLENIGIKGHQRELDDESIEAGDKLFAKMKANKLILESYSDDELTADELLSKQIATYLFDSLESAEKFRFHNYPVNQLFGVQNSFPSFMESTHPIETLDDAYDYIWRLEGIPTKFRQVLDGLKHRQSLGIIPPAFVIERVIEEMTQFYETPIKESILYTTLETKMSEAGISDDQAQQVLERAVPVIDKFVFNSYHVLTDYFEDLRPFANSDDGVWKLPDGDEFYQQTLKFFTTTDYTPEQIHNIGLSEVERIQGEILAILTSEGRDVSAGFFAAMEALKADPSFYYPDTDEGREQILKDYQKIIDEINLGLDSAFAIRPEAGVEVKRIPEFKEKTAPGAYYNQPAMDGSRPGIFYANLYDIKATPKYSMRTLAYHEAIPGHHFQVAIAQELDSVPLFRRFAPFVAYIEGWALYAEQVAWELGFQQNPYDNIGRLQAELFRAVRLVVDTGIHYKRWTREQGIEYMMANTGMAESDVIAEIERYIVMPGQATSYKVGMMKILELRTKAQNALGEKFNLSDFHDVVLKNGAVPLAVLEQLVDRYIAEQQAL